DSAHGCACESGAKMTKRTRRNHSPDFKAKVALAAMKGDRTIAQLSDQFGVHVSQITAWKEQLQAGAANVFGPGTGTAAAAPSIDVKALDAKIGELTLENDSYQAGQGSSTFTARAATACWPAPQESHFGCRVT